jgi:UDP-GlcNAc:undecaprenyl-phosphate/decaprenyl-phosphate GlcNAc-1-phosphate transferase
MGKYLTLLFISCGLSLLLTPLLKYLAVRWGALDIPNERKIHGRPTPRFGGISIFIAFNLVFLASQNFDFFYFPPSFLTRINYLWLFAASLIILIIGTVDDFRSLPPSHKLFFQIIGALIISLSSYRIEVVTSPFGTLGLGVWSVPATVLWVVAITNSLNLLDGLDGLAAGTAFIVSLSIFCIALINDNIGSALFSIILAGAALGFLKYNFHPASIFLGNAGSYYLGFMLSILSLESNSKDTTTVIILIPILLLGLPIMETILSMLRRLLKSLHIVGMNGNGDNGRFFFLNRWRVFQADRDHIHHRLLQMGFNQSRAVIVLYTISLILGALAFSSVYFHNINQALLIMAIGIASYVGIKKLKYSEIQVLRNGALLPLFDTPLISQRILKTSFDLGFIALSYYLAFLLRFEGELASAIRKYYLFTLPLVLAAKLLIFYLSGLYRGVWQYAGVADLMRVAKATVLACVVAAVLLRIIPGFGVLSWAVLVIDFNMLFLMVLGLRSSFRILEHLHNFAVSEGKKVLIYGVGPNAVPALKEIIHNPRLHLIPVGFIDDDEQNQGIQVDGYPVLGSLESLGRILQEQAIAEIIVSRNDIPVERLSRLAEVCRARRISLRRFQTHLEEVFLPL